MNQIRVLIADDHRLYAEGLQRILETTGDIRVVGHAADGTAAVKMAQELSPDVVLMDISMPGLDGIEAVRAIRACCPHIRIVVVTMHMEALHVRSAVKAGIHGYLPKTAGAYQLFDAVRKVNRGGAAFHEGVVPFVVQEAGDHSAAPSAGLSPREQDVVRLLGAGTGTKEIAEKLGISEKTVRNHLEHMYRKLQVKSRAELILLAAKLGGRNTGAGP